MMQAEVVEEHAIEVIARSMCISEKKVSEVGVDTEWTLGPNPRAPVSLVPHTQSSLFLETAMACVSEADTL